MAPAESFRRRERSKETILAQKTLRAKSVAKALLIFRRSSPSKVSEAWKSMRALDGWQSFPSILP